MINRSIVVVRPAAPYFAWARRIAGDELDVSPLEDIATAYLVPPFDDLDGGEKVLQVAWEPLFEEELASWDTHEPDWPQGRSLEMFRKWFKIQLYPMVMDLCEGEPIGEE